LLLIGLVWMAGKPESRAAAADAGGAH
jgi:hypothetical protein